ncbi:acyl carrier protein [Streptomyces ureilyticus]|jgi:acyl carrier protein|uniref:Acyl carrier protein n=1 Tax=Streptomyces ureilyticus TaxID=1775131 RepID=A0ABX0E348_9ACTN|nr:acyl carrier protein [Streptomyces ureilyticus]NGO46973.1 acyl carrier protein [Streptomyces ureilyticus]
MATAAEDVLAFLTRALGSPVGPDDDYFADGRANSLFALELVAFVEHRFRLTVEAEDLDVGNFRTAANILAFVTAKTGDRSPGAVTDAANG